MRKLLLLLVGLTGCQSYDDVERADMAQYLGRPARVFSEEKALAPTQVFDRPNGQRVYQFPYRLCTFTVLARPRIGDGEYVSEEIRKTC